MSRLTQCDAMRYDVVWLDVAVFGCGDRRGYVDEESSAATSRGYFIGR